MAVVLRLARHGKKGLPIYRIVAAEKENKRDGKFLSIVGTYNPNTNPLSVNFKEDLVKKWLDVGARPTASVANLIEKSFPGLYKGKVEHKKSKIQAKRKARKSRAAKGSKSKK